jgi:hypothetical protein
MRSAILLASMIIANYFSDVTLSESYERINIVILIVFIIFVCMDIVDFAKNINNKK